MYFLIFDWINKDSRTINRFIHWGNSLKMDFTERQFLNYRNTVMGWLSDYWHKKGDKELSAQYFAKLVDTIILMANLLTLKQMPVMMSVINFVIVNCLQFSIY